VGKPVIGAINGFAITGGFEIALMCDFLIASPDARFADTHARVGVVPGWGLSQRLPRLIGINRAKELSLTGNYLDADTACAWGLVNKVVSADELLPACERLARDIVSTEPVTRAEIRRIMDEGWAATLDEGLAIENTANRAHAKNQRPSEQVASRRQQIQDRGRNQAGD
jgi:enoyl-CoA hydratase